MKPPIIIEQRIVRLIGIVFIASIGAAHAATFTVTTAASDGVGSFSQAIRDADASADPTNTINFGIPPFDGTVKYIVPPVGGFPLIIKDNVTVDGYSQPGSVVNTAPITATNNAKIRIALDGSLDARYRDMAYVYYNLNPALNGYGSLSDPPIDNSSMANPLNPASNSRERGGFDPSDNGLDPAGTPPPYAIGERAVLGVYRAQNVTIKGLAFIGYPFDDTGHYLLAVAQDYGLGADQFTVKDRFTYDNGTSRGLHVAGCWFGIDPGTGATPGSDIGIAMFRHRDNAGTVTTNTRPDLANGENSSIGVAPGAADPRAEFNVFAECGLSIGGECLRIRVAGNQFLYGAIGDLGGNRPEFGRFDDTQVPSILWGTDGDGVNDAEEGNLFQVPASLYNTGNKSIAFAGNIFGLALDGSRLAKLSFAVDGFSFNQNTKVRFGSDFNGVSDALEANKLYDTLMFAGDHSTATNNAWVSLRGNVLVNNGAMPPLDPVVSAGVYDKWIDTTAPNPITPALSPSSTVSSLSGTCGLPLPGVARMIVDLYLADPEGDLIAIPQGKTYLGTFEDNSPADSNPAVGAFTFNIASLGIASGTKVTAAVTYSKDTQPTITSVSHSGSATTITISGGSPTYNIQRASVVTGPYTTIAVASGASVTFSDAATTSFYRVVTSTASGQTSPFAPSVALLP